MNIKDYAEKSRKLSEAGTPGPWRQGHAVDGVFAEGADGYIGDIRELADEALVAHNRTAADVWREAFFDLAAMWRVGEKSLAEEIAFDRAYAKVTTPEAVSASDSSKGAG